MPDKNIKYMVSLLKNSHLRDSFCCQVAVLDDYLKTKASQDVKRYIAASYVLTKEDENKVLGYYTLSATAIDVSELPYAMNKKLPRYPTVPATLLGRLAVDEKYQKQNLGEFLLIDALRRSLELSDKIASMAVLVDAKDNKAKSFYLRYGFIEFKKLQNRLFLPMGTIKKIFQ